MLDPIKVAGKIVLCKRGVNARTEKGEEVLAAGGVGVILYNSPDSSLAADLHWVPTGRPLTMTASVTGLTGIAVQVSPSTLTVAPGDLRALLDLRCGRCRGYGP